MPFEAPQPNVVTWGVRPEARTIVGNLVPEEFAHAIPLPRNNMVVQFYPAGLTSRVRRGR